MLRRAFVLVCFGVALVLGAAGEAQQGVEKPPGPAPAEQQPEPEVWHSREACERVVQSKKGSSSETSVRLATWNVRWFPDAVLDPEEGNPGTAIQWLSCAVTALNAPVVAVQEFRNHERGKSKMRALLESLDTRTGGSWQIELDSCPGEGDTHVGFLYDSARVSARGFRTVTRLSASGSCEQGQH